MNGTATNRSQPSAKPSNQSPRGPQPLTAEQLKLVAGGAPKGGWGPVAIDGKAPKGGW